MPNLVEMTSAAFADNGPLAQSMAARGRRYVCQEPQVDYAGRVARTFAAPAGERGVVALLDAETGIGKSLGYLIPIGLAVATERVLGLVSTFTLLLQHQVLDEDFPIAAEVVQAITGRAIRAAPRMGLRNFIAPSRVVHLQQAIAAAGTISPETAAVLTSLADDKAGDGTIRSWMERNGRLPPGIQETDICLLRSDGEDAEAFNQHINRAGTADVIVITHAMLARSMLRWNSTLRGLGDDNMPPFAVGVVDEADRLPRVAADVFTVRLSIPMLRAMATSLPGIAGRKALRTVDAASDWFDGVQKDAQPNLKGNTMVLGTAASADIRDAARDHARMISDALTRAGAGANLAADDASTVKSMAIELAQFAYACEDMTENQVPALRWSPVRAYAGFSVVPLKPGRLCARLWQPIANKPPFLRSLVMTSATLDAPGSPRPFLQFKADIGLFGDNFSSELSGRFAPRKFGSLRFVLADPSTPPPTTRLQADGDDEDDSGVTTDVRWLLYAVQAVSQAASRGGRCLVLTTSFRDTEAMCSLLREMEHVPIEHRRGQRLAECLDAFRLDQQGLMLSPAAWEGVNLPGLLSHLVIPRIPFAPLATTERQVTLDSLIAKGWSQQHAESIFFKAAAYDALRRLRQGLGRAIRSATDDVTAWILDPRFPTPQEVVRRENLDVKARQMPGFEMCVPVRFRTGLRATLPNAEVFYAPETVNSAHRSDCQADEIAELSKKWGMIDG